MTPTELLAELHTKLKAAIQADYTHWIGEFDDVCGYAICAPPYVESIFPAYQLKSEELEDASVYYPAEWSSFGSLEFDQGFQKFCGKIHERRNLSDTNAAEGLDADSVFNTILAVLAELEAEGLFGDKASGRFLTIWDVGNDEEWILKASKKLNANKIHTRARRALLGE
jgi:hypothetical protein